MTLPYNLIIRVTLTLLDKAYYAIARATLASVGLYSLLPYLYRRLAYLYSRLTYL